MEKKASKKQPSYNTMQQLIKENFKKVLCKVGSQGGAKCLFMNGPEKELEEACRFAFERGSYTISSCPSL